MKIVRKYLLAQLNLTMTLLLGQAMKTQKKDLIPTKAYGLFSVQIRFPKKISIY